MHTYSLSQSTRRSSGRDCGCADRSRSLCSPTWKVEIRNNQLIRDVGNQHLLGTETLDVVPELLLDVSEVKVVHGLLHVA